MKKYEIIFVNGAKTTVMLESLEVIRDPAGRTVNYGWRSGSDDILRLVSSDIMCVIERDIDLDL
ncbi:hypothetical protein QEH42_gp199 [Microbacterium phage Pumpernickel]|uniref:Uncharacterized protein n=1 Tax=Microbacterium phage Pumpernickel TaxID=2885983 RepID=A0AAE8YBQ0_9CAUD|nr:hypothetical protein QEH42_gp199 [Microbacterium phage Pumpernickel]UDL16019.1 hypothetical protein SEA_PUMPERNICKEL_269 [Microbacterium phage Pumpernickel]